MSAYINRWPRAVARVLDLFWQLLLVTPLLTWMALAAGFHLENSLLFFVVISFVSLPFAFVLDALVAGLFGNSPAKALIGLKVKTSKGQTLRMSEHLRRNYEVWTQGFAVGFLPFTIASGIKQFKQVSGRRPATYDELLHFQMHSAAFSGARASLAVGLLFVSPLVLIMLMPFVNDGSDDREVRPTANPGTHPIGPVVAEAAVSESVVETLAATAKVVAEPVAASDVAAVERSATGDAQPAVLIGNSAGAGAEAVVLKVAAVPETLQSEVVSFAGNYNLSVSEESEPRRWVNPITGYETTLAKGFSVKSGVLEDGQLAVFDYLSGNAVVSLEKHQSPRGFDVAEISKFLQRQYPSWVLSNPWSSYPLGEQRVFQTQGSSGNAGAPVSIQATAIEGGVYVLMAKGNWLDSDAVELERLNVAVWNTF